MTAATLPDGWRTVRLGDVCDRPRYGASAAARDYDASLPRYVRITDITDEGRLRLEDLRSADPESVDGHELHPGDLLFARSGSVGRTYLYRAEDGPCVYAGYLIRFRPDPKDALPNFLHHYTHSTAYYRWIAAVSRAGAQPNINANEYSSLPVLLPPLEEQRAIAGVLDAIDETIERTDAVIETTETLRDALLHDLLTRGILGRHTEWQDIPGLGPAPADWHVTRLGDVTSVRAGTGFPLDRQGRTGGAYPFIKVSDMNLRGNETLIHRATHYVDEADVRDLGAHIFGPGTVVFPKVGAAISTNKKRALTIPTLIDNNLLGVSVSDFRRMDSRFLHVWFETVHLQGLANVSAVPSITSSRVKEFDLALPTLEEQREIADVLNSVDATLEAARAERATLETAKASTADALLIGRVRTPAAR